jgi:ribosomal-protein-alanine N-acetyltransferase
LRYGYEPVIEFRGYRSSDLRALVELANNRNVSEYLADRFPFPYTEEDAIWWIGIGCKQNDCINFAIENDGVLVGGIGVEPQDGQRRHCAEIGYWLGQPYWGQGIATSAVHKMTDYAFLELGFSRLYAPVLEPNRASMKVLEKCGYALEGILRNDIRKNDTFYNVHYYAKNRG